MKIYDFREVIVWQKAHILTLEIYKISSSFPKDELYALTSQMRRAALSVPANFVEGFNRKGLNDERRFYNIAQGSLAELQYFIILSKDLNYIDDVASNTLYELTIEVSKLLYSWIKSLERSDLQTDRLNRLIDYE